MSIIQHIFLLSFLIISGLLACIMRLVCMIGTQRTVTFSLSSTGNVFIPFFGMRNIILLAFFADISLPYHVSISFLVMTTHSDIKLSLVFSTFEQKCYFRSIPFFKTFFWNDLEQIFLHRVSTQSTATTEESGFCQRHCFRQCFSSILFRYQAHIFFVTFFLKTLTLFVILQVNLGQFTYAGKVYPHLLGVRARYRIITCFFFFYSLLYFLHFPIEFL